MSDYRASSGSLTSPSPSPPPEPFPNKKPPSTPKTTGLDSSSELSELTEDEQDATRDSTHSSTPQDNRRLPRRKRSGIVPEPMWDWAYKTNGRRQHDIDEPPLSPNKISTPASSSSTTRGHDTQKHDIDNDEDEGDTKTQSRQLPSEVDDEDGGDEQDEHESEEEEENGDDPIKIADPAVSVVKDATRESSMVLTEDAASSDYSMESEDEEQQDEEEEAPPDEEADVEAEDDATIAKNADIAPVVPLAPAGSSIMAGQQIIKSPSTSPSTSPEPEEEQVEEPPHISVEKPMKVEPIEPDTVVDPEVDNDEDAEDPEKADADADPDAEVEAEVENEETETDLQPAHRVEALEVLAQIELRFGLIREALYVEKMEELAMEEAMILQGTHPEMIHLQTELQNRHDKRLELAAKKRKYEDDHVTMMRKGDEDAIWGWWKFEKEELRNEMHADANRKKRRLEREKRLLERAHPVLHIPQPPAGLVPNKSISIKEMMKFASLDSSHTYSSKLKRKRKDLDHGYPYSSLSMLSTKEIQIDRQAMSSSRSRSFHPPIANEMGPPMGIVQPFEQHYVDYATHPGMMPPHGHGPFVHGIPPASMAVHHSYPPPPPGRVYHQPPGPPPPMGSIHHPGNRSNQGPGAPHTGYMPRPGRRSPSPPPSQNYDQGGPVNGNNPYVNGPNQHWGPIQSAVPPSSSGAGPSKSIMNGYPKEHRRDARERERDVKERERERIWHDTNTKDTHVSDEYGRVHQQHVHRHPPVHQTLQGVPHHHHVVHRHPPPHHHHSSRPPPLHTVHRQHEVEQESASRHPPPTIEQINLIPKPVSNSSFWRQEEEREQRERERSRNLPPGPPGPPPPMSQLSPPAERERSSQPSSLFVMTPSQAMQQSNFNPSRQNEGATSRREPWMDERNPRYEQPESSTHIPADGGRRPHTHSRQGSASTIVINNNNTSSPRPRNGSSNGIPPSSPPPMPPTGPGVGPAPSYTPSLLHSPSRRSGASPRTMPSSTPKTGSGRSLSPLPTKPIAFTPGHPVGPGTPGGTGSRLGTPGLTGPGTRPDVSLNSHGMPAITHGPGLYSSTTGLAGPAQPLALSSGNDPGHMAPPKMTAVPLSNGS